MQSTEPNGTGWSTLTLVATAGAAAVTTAAIVYLYTHRSQNAPSVIIVEPVSDKDGHKDRDRESKKKWSNRKKRRSRSSMNKDDSGVEHLALKELLDGTPISDAVPPERKLVVIEANEVLDHAIMKLHDNTITAAPVVDLVRREYLGLFSTLDLAAYLLSLRQSAGDYPSRLPEVPVSTLVNFSKATPFESVLQTQPLSALMTLFANGVHRVLVKNDADNICNIISQTDVLNFLLIHREALGGSIRQSKAKLSLREWGMMEGHPFRTVTTEARVADALPHLFHVVAVAIVDPTGKLLGDLSTNNLKSLSQYDVEKRLDEPVTFMGDMNCVCVRVTATLDEVVSKVVSGKKQRVWVLDRHDVPITLITHLDIIKKLIEK